MSGLNEDTASLDVSADETLDEPTASAAGGAESSPAADGDKESLLSVVRDAVERTAAASPADNSDTGGGDAAGDAQAPREQDDENFSDVPFHKHPRFREVLSQRNEARVNAQRYDNLTKYLNENALTGEDAAQALHWAALLKGDPMKAWETLRPVMAQLALTVGAVLPPDIRAEVQAGRMTQEYAQRLAQERAKATTLEGRMSFQQRVAERQRAADEEAARREAAQTVKRAVGAWEQAKRDSDPDFAKLGDDLTKEVLWLQRKDGTPDTPDGVRKQLDAAYKAVKSRLTAAAPRRPDITPVNGGRTGGTPRAEPETMLDVIRANRRAG